MLEQMPDSCALAEFHQKPLFLLTALARPVCQVAGPCTLQNIGNGAQGIRKEVITPQTGTVSLGSLPSSLTCKPRAELSA